METSQKAGQKDGIGAEDGDIRDLFSYNLQRLAGVSTRIALLDIKPIFSLNMHDWRAMAVLDYLGAAPLQVLAQRAGVQKSQMSRTAAALEARGLVERRENPKDGRSSLLQLTMNGKKVAREVLATSHQRNRRMLKYLSHEERIQLMTLMDKVIRGSLELLKELRGRDDAENLQMPEPQTLFEQENL